MTLNSVPSTPKPEDKAPRSRPALLPVILVVLLILAVGATGFGALAAATGPKAYTCVNVAQSGSQLNLTTNGLIHYNAGQYYITCPEGYTYPLTQFKDSCLTISPQQLIPDVGTAAAAYYAYYLSAPGHAMSVVGMSSITNGTEIVTPSAEAMSISC